MSSSITPGSKVVSPLPRATVPVTSVPMRVALDPVARGRGPCRPDADAAVGGDDVARPAAVPPTVLFGALDSEMPSPALPRRRVPVTSVPMKLPAITLFEELSVDAGIGVARVGGDDVALGASDTPSLLVPIRFG